MARTKITIALDEQTLRQFDHLVAEAVCLSRSQAIHRLLLATAPPEVAPPA